MQYRFLLPSPSLRPYIQFYGLLRQDDSASNPTTDDWVAPYLGKGLVFVLRRAGEIRVSNRHFDLPAPAGYFLPQCTQRFRIQLSGEVLMLAVVFKPGQFRRFFRLSSADLVDRQVLTFDDVNLWSLRELQERLYAPAPLGDRVALVESFLLAQLARHDRVFSLTDATIDRLFQAPNPTRLSTMSADLGYSDRYLRKVFRRDIGIRVKTFQRILRFNRAFLLIKSGQYRRLTDIAYTAGYFDQSHFIREFQEFTGVTPRQFLRETHPLQNELHWH